MRAVYEIFAAEDACYIWVCNRSHVVQAPTSVANINCVGDMQGQQSARLCASKDHRHHDTSACISCNDRTKVHLLGRSRLRCITQARCAANSTYVSASAGLKTQCSYPKTGNSYI